MDPEMHQDQRELDIVRHLISFFEVDVNCRDEHGRNCLYHAVTQHNYGLAGLLLDAGAKTESSNPSQDQLQEIRRIRSVFIPIPVITREFQALNPLYFSMHLGDLRMVRILIEKGAEISQVEFKAAVAMNHLNVIRFCLELGFDVNTLVDYEHYSMNIKCTILHMAAKLGKPAVLDYLLQEWNASVNVHDTRGSTPLSDAIESGHKKSVEILLVHHNNLPTYWGSSILDLAIRESLNTRNPLFPGRPRVRSSSEKVFADIVDLLVRHVAMLQSHGLFVDPDTYIQIEKNPSAKDYMNICKFELERMKASPINDTFTLYDLLVKKDLGLFLRDESVVKILESSSLDGNFPMYGKLIRDRFEIKRKKMAFENKVISGLSKIFGQDLSAHHLICNHILKYLRTSDLHILSKI